MRVQQRNASGKQLMRMTIAAIILSILIPAALFIYNNRPTPVELLKGHDGDIFFLTFSPDGKTLASGGGDKVVLLWDTLLGGVRAKLTGHTAVVSSGEFSKDGRVLVTASWDGTMRLWDLRDAKLIKVIKGDGEALRSVVFGQDEKTLIVGTDEKGVKVWDIESGEKLFTQTNATAPLAITPDKKTIATGSQPHSVTLWNLEGWKEIKKLSDHTELIHAIVFSDDGAVMGTASADSQAGMWQTKTGWKTRSLSQHNAEVYAIAFVPKSDNMVSGAGSAVQLWNSEGDKLGGFSDFPGKIFALAISPDGQKVVVGGTDGKLGLYEFTVLTNR